jgi:hypothetical protein
LCSWLLKPINLASKTPTHTRAVGLAHSSYLLQFLTLG